MDVTVISKETIKPSSPTPAHLRSFKLSLIDQYQPLIYVRILLFYSAEGKVDRFKNAKTSNLLKKSLSENLTEFYPVAGKFDYNNQSIDCDDTGVEYLEAQVTGALNAVLSCPNAKELIQLFAPNQDGIGIEGLSAVQVNIFDCGGMAIGVSISHIIADASSLSTFFHRWAAIARGSNETVSPKKFGFASVLFPPRDEVKVEITPYKGDDTTTIPRFASKRFVFDASKIAALKAKSANKLYVEFPTRLEAVGALLLRCMMRVARPRSSKFNVAHIPVNLRSRINPPLPQSSFGNLIIGTMSAPWTTESEPEMHCFVGQLSEAIRKIDDKYLENLQDDNGLLLFERLSQSKELYLKPQTKVYTVTSWCRFQFYKTDFGWGEPIWASTVTLMMLNSVLLLDTKIGDGVEAWVTLDEEDMARFECEQELLDFACANPLVCESV